ncbi:hypothetical protein BD410DRAFT_785871 [Rickenella mellea]|uniref:Mid2 domain-containing protein n=1 Tax=Rickenella mellea TaxID=50990 RepID=A0A4Y7QAD9_9AGAM|nr:hypothetical protein BD410DRAFT_785871 [Rickenella mellea]
MSVLPSPIYFPEITNVTTCEPYEFTFAYVSTSPTFTSNVSENTLTAYVQWIIGDDPGVMEYTLVNNVTLYPSFTSLIWSPVDAGPGAYVIKGNVYSDAGIVYEETSRFFSIEAGTDESCITQSVVATTTAANDVPTSTAIESASTTGRSKLSGGAIAGIVIGIVAVKLIALLVAIVLMRRRRAAAQKSQARSSFRMATIPTPPPLPPMTKEEEKEREAYMWSDTASLRSIPPPYGHA